MVAHLPDDQAAQETKRDGIRVVEDAFPIDPFCRREREGLLALSLGDRPRDRGPRERPRLAPRHGPLPALAGGLVIYQVGLVAQRQLPPVDRVLVLRLGLAQQRRHGLGGRAKRLFLLPVLLLGGPDSLCWWVGVNEDKCRTMVWHASLRKKPWV